MDITSLPTLNACLNGTATVLLLIGWYAIKNEKKLFHARMMSLAFGVSILFLISYLYYHFNTEAINHYQGQGLLRPIYFFILLTHIPLAALVPPLALITLYFAIRQKFDKHKKIARWLLPIWLYVSVTGVLIYLMLYGI